MRSIYEGLVWWRNLLIGVVYRRVLKPVLFLFDPEDIHDLFTWTGRILGSNLITRNLTRLFFGYQHQSLVQDVLGIKFNNPIGLAAGFDKDALLTDVIPFVGFGFEEGGSISGVPCAGNQRPRLWRLKKSKGLVVNYGLKNRGSEEISRRLNSKQFIFPIGTNVVMANMPETLKLEVGIADYVKAFKAFAHIGDYTTINISCPNTYCGQPFHDADKLELLLTEIDKIETKKPVFIKITPDLDFSLVDDILDVAVRHRIAGFVCTNLTKNRQNSKIVDKKIPTVGGISGMPVKDLADEMIKHIFRKAGHRFVLIGCGGVFTAEDAYRKIRLGASLVQLITGMIFEGPQNISVINQGLVRLLKRDGFTHIKEAVGADNLI
ncbi:MAG: quinone-dependent dihydroorotate dehydrogenase [bacterium]